METTIGWICGALAVLVLTYLAGYLHGATREQYNGARTTQILIGEGLKTRFEVGVRYEPENQTLSVLRPKSEGKKSGVSE